MIKLITLITVITLNKTQCVIPEYLEHPRHLANGTNFVANNFLPSSHSTTCMHTRHDAAEI